MPDNIIRTASIHRPSTDRRPRTDHRAAAALVAVAVISVSCSIEGNGMAVVGLAITRDFDAPQYYPWISTTFLVASIVGVLAAGRVRSAAGERRLLRAGLALATLGGLIAAAAGSISIFLCGRVIAGVGIGALTAVVYQIATSQRGYAARSAILGVITASLAIGSALGPLVGGVCAGGSWRMFIAAVTVVVVTAGIVLAQATPASTDIPRQRSDLPTRWMVSVSIGAAAAAAAHLIEPFTRPGFAIAMAVAAAALIASLVTALPRWSRTARWGLWVGASTPALVAVATFALGGFLGQRHSSMIVGCALAAGVAGWLIGSIWRPAVSMRAVTAWYAVVLPLSAACLTVATLIGAEFPAIAAYTLMSLVAGVVTPSAQAHATASDTESALSTSTVLNATIALCGAAVMGIAMTTPILALH